MIEIKKLPSGFYAVFFNGAWIDAASATIEQAEQKAKKITEEIKKMKYTVKATRHSADTSAKNKSFIVEELRYSGDTLKEAMQKFRVARDNNDMTKFSRIYIYDVIEE